ncbi:protein PXR1-like, partial [Protobothrops mucrosquamatus]|uniref:protein PXR1-like n=1 Tax=Protobothrops mucrosquamatus TaxID=103944 RepID=UPI000775A79C
MQCVIHTLKYISMDDTAEELNAPAEELERKEGKKKRERKEGRKKKGKKEGKDREGKKEGRKEGRK